MGNEVVILITGASKGIGKYLFNRFSDGKLSVYGTYNVTYPDIDKIDYYRKVDVSYYTDVQKWISETLNIRKDINEITLINCAGINYSSFLHKADVNEWARVINVNLIGTFNVIHAVLPAMRGNKFGRIINFSSVVSQIGIPGTSAYAASKAGLSGMIRSIAVENAKYKITVNNIRLGYFNIGMITEVPKDMQNIIKSKIPLGYFGNPEDIFGLVNFIRKTEYINGTCIDLNGGII